MRSEGAQHQSRKARRKLTLLLFDGSPTGVIKAELGNWSGEILAAPRTALAELAKSKEAARTGVYLLKGTDPDDPTRPKVYVGESRNIGKRLANHDAEKAKPFFTRVCLIVSKDKNLTKAHVLYLEARIMEQIRKADRAVLANSTNPDPGGLPESDEADMEVFLSEIEIVLPVLDFDILRRAAESGGADDVHGSAPPVFTLTGRDFNASLKKIAGAFVVLAGSLARVKETCSFDNSGKNRRRQLVEDGDFETTEDGRCYRFTRDVDFSSPSAAARAVYGGSINGQDSWKHKDNGLSYKEWHQQALA